MEETITVEITGKPENLVKPREGDVGWDVIAETEPIHQDGFVEYGTGIHLSIPEGWFAAVYPRSSISIKAMALCNAVAVIDPSYRGEIRLRFRDLGGRLYKKGDKIAQIVFQKYTTPRVVTRKKLGQTVRGAGGFGSTGE